MNSPVYRKGHHVTINEPRATDYSEDLTKREIAYNKAAETLRNQIEVTDKLLTEAKLTPNQGKPTAKPCWNSLLDGPRDGGKAALWA